MPILFLDEINRASVEVQQCAFQIVLDRELNGMKLHPETRLYSAINEGTHYQVNEMGPALTRRFWVVDLEPTTEDWLEWAENNPPAPWNHYFDHVSLNRAVWNIKDGKVSPWLILNCNSGKNMMSKFNEEQLGIVYHVLDPEHWAMRFKRQQDDVQLVKDVCKESNL